MRNVDSAQVPGLIDEEVKDIYCVQDGNKNNVRVDPAMDLVLIRNVGQITRSESAYVCEFWTIFVETYMSVHAMMPGLPLVNNFRSKSPQILGLSSIPMYKSYNTDPGKC